MNAYKVLLGCLVIICYLQQHGGWSAPTPNEIDDSLMEEIPMTNLSEEPNFNEITNLSKNNQSIVHKRSLLLVLEGLNHMLRNKHYMIYMCTKLELLQILKPYILNVSYSQEFRCGVYLLDDPLPTLSPRLQKAMDTMDDPTCIDIAFYMAYYIKITEVVEFSTHSGTPYYVCCLRRMIKSLRFIQYLRGRTCPRLLRNDYLEIYDCDRNTFHVPENVNCVLYSLQHMMTNYRLGSKGRGVTNIDLHCDEISTCQD